MLYQGVVRYRDSHQLVCDRLELQLRLEFGHPVEKISRVESLTEFFTAIIRVKGKITP